VYSTPVKRTIQSRTFLSKLHKLDLLGALQDALQALLALAITHGVLVVIFRVAREMYDNVSMAGPTTCVRAASSLLCQVLLLGL